MSFKEVFKKIRPFLGVIIMVLLFLICCSHFEQEHILTFAFLTVETLIVKSIIIPWFLFRVLKKTNSNRDFAPNVPHFYCLVIASVILLASFLISNYWVSSIKMLSPIHFGISVSTIIISLWLITDRRTYESV